MDLFDRHAKNPILTPGLFDWRQAVVFNPGVIHEAGEFYLFERTAGALRPFHCYISAMHSEDGVHFTPLSERPVLTPEMAGSRYGSVQDPRVVRIEDTYYMTYAFRPYAWNSHPTGTGVPESYQAEFPGFSGRAEDNQTRSGIAVSKDLLNWKHKVWATPEGLDDRDVILFPEKIDGKFVLLRRPLAFVGGQYGTDRPGIWICHSEDLETWSVPRLLAQPRRAWEGDRIGASTPPIRTEQGWLLLYHGVELTDADTRRVVYRVGAMLLDPDQPSKVLARTPEPIFEPREYYEHFGLYIPHVVFPTGAVVVDETLWMYYGVCDTAIALARAPLSDLIRHLGSLR
jgi:predicted GH43/DUF377 family glycosyl hydrolase